VAVPGLSDVGAVELLTTVIEGAQLPRQGRGGKMGLRRMALRWSRDPSAPAAYLRSAWVDTDPAKLYHQRLGDEGSTRDLAALAVPSVGALRETGDPWEPYRLVDAAGEPVVGVTEFFRDLQAAGRSEATLRSYGSDLLRWFRFLWAIQTPWSRATRAAARPLCRGVLVAGKPVRPHWRSPVRADQVGTTSGKPYAPSVRTHCETVLRCFYDFHLSAGSGPVINPFPLDLDQAGPEGTRSPQPDGAVPQRASRALPAEGALQGSAQRSG
jgi:hypothetical protein